MVAHEQRRHMAERLAEQVQARVFYDDGTLGEQANHARALAWLAQQDADWVTLLEDDAVPCPDYLTVQAHGLAHAPTRHLVSQYLGTGRWAGANPTHHAPRVAALVRQAQTTGQPWITSHALWHAVGISLPTRAAHHAVTYLGSRTPTDQALTRWARRTGWRIAYAWPSWLDHDDGPTVTQHPDHQPRTQPRHAWSVVGAEHQHGEHTEHEQLSAAR